MSNYLDTFNEVRRQRLEDYRRANKGEITWREYAAKWGVFA